MKYFPTILAFSAILFGTFVLTAAAQSYTPLAPLPGTFTGTEAAPKTDMATYLAGAIKLLLAIGASLAILMTVIGGTQYVAAGISPDAKSSAKEMITNAFIGLALMLVSYLILNSINPKLVQFDLSLKNYTAKVTDLTILEGSLVPGLAKNIAADPKAQAYINSQVKECLGIDDFKIEQTTTEAQEMEAEKGNGPPNWKVLPDTPNAPAIQANLNNLRTEVVNLQTALAKTPGRGAKINSAYRPYEYQKHLWYIYDAWVTKGLNNNTTNICANAKRAIGDEYAAHGLGSLVANPDVGYAPHVRGTGVDLGLTGIPENTVDQFLIDNNIKLCWQNIPGDKWHFNYKPNPTCPPKN